MLTLLFYLSQGTGANSEMKIADFGLSALVRIEEGVYDPEESGKRKNYRLLKDVSFLMLFNISIDAYLIFT